MTDTAYTEPCERVLVVANETMEGTGLADAISAHAGSSPVFVVAPALNSRLRYWTSDEDPARRSAAARLEALLARLEEVGVEAQGRVGDADPLLAIADALDTFAASRLVIATHPENRSNWLAHQVVERARARFGLPTLHVVVDVVRQVEYVASEGYLPAAA